MTSVAHVITGLGSGGAEGFLARLAPAALPLGIESHVFSLTDDGVHGEELRQDGIPVCPLGLLPTRPDPRSVVRLVAHLRDIRPDVVMTWLYHADLLGGLAGRIARVPVVWNIRQSAMGPEAPTRHHWLVGLNARLSHTVPTRIVCVSHQSLADHVAVGYPARRMQVIHNGFDLQRFRPDPAARVAVRKDLGIPFDARVIGHVARFDPQKDHATMLLAAADVIRGDSAVHLVMCGDGTDEVNGDLSLLIDAVGIDRQRVHRLGRRNDVDKLSAAWDVAVSSSAYGEGLTNALAEAMACGVPCVATASGDAAELLGGTGVVVPVRDPQALAEGIRFTLSRSEVPSAATRQRMIEHFDLASAVAAYAQCVSEVGSDG